MTEEEIQAWGILIGRYLKRHPEVYEAIITEALEIQRKKENQSD
jgi:hypothetical protein